MGKMCGFLFVKKLKNIKKNKLDEFLHEFSWRGPNYSGSKVFNNGTVYLGHNRLSIRDLSVDANQPMCSANKRYEIIYNGELYNAEELRNHFKIKCRTTSDTEVILELFSMYLEASIPLLRGMFSFVIYDTISNDWFAVRDQFGIKPLYYFKNNCVEILCSEPKIIAQISNVPVDESSLDEWQFLRRPTPGFTFYKNIKEILPATYLKNGVERKYWERSAISKRFDQVEFEFLLSNSIKKHLISDVKVVSMLSGGMDSAAITKIAHPQKCYSVGLLENNEFVEAAQTASEIGIDLEKVNVTQEELIYAWRYLTKLKGEPLSVPNEGLIFLCCKRMASMEKVVLSGEGADEILFGYDRIFKWAASTDPLSVDEFISRYGYSENYKLTERFSRYVENIAKGKKTIDFVEDFFLDFHLPGLLRRMDFASMAASKEVRVPFLDIELANYMYRRDFSIRTGMKINKFPLARFLRKMNLNSVVKRKKVGFSAQFKHEGKSKDYDLFKQITLECLQ